MSEMIFFYVMSIGEGCTRHQQNVASRVIDCCSAVGGFPISFNCWYWIFRHCWSYDNFFLPSFLQLSNLADSFFNKTLNCTDIHRPLYVSVCIQTCTNPVCLTGVLKGKICFHINVKLSLYYLNTLKFCFQNEIWFVKIYFPVISFSWNAQIST